MRLLSRQAASVPAGIQVGFGLTLLGCQPPPPETALLTADGQRLSTDAA